MEPRHWIGAYLQIGVCRQRRPKLRKRWRGRWLTNNTETGPGLLVNALPLNPDCLWVDGSISSILVPLWPPTVTGPQFVSRRIHTDAHSASGSVLRSKNRRFSVNLGLVLDDLEKTDALRKPTHIEYTLTHSYSDYSRL